MTHYAPTRVSLAFAVALLTGTSAVSSAQPAQQPIPTPFTAGGGLVIAQPVGEFADYVGTGFGLAVHGLVRFDEAGAFSLRAEGGFINYGNETKKVCFSATVGCRVELDLTTSNNIGFGNIGPQLEVPVGPIRPFAHAGIGFAYFGTTSGVSGTDSGSEQFAQTTNFSDVTFAWGAGGGLRIPFRVAGHEAGILFDARYHGNGSVEYLREGDIQDHPDGSITYTPTRSDANLVTYQIGASFRVSLTN